MDWPDLIVIALTVIFALLAVRRGFVAVLLSIVGLAVTFVLVFSLYQGLGSFISERFGWSAVWSKPVAFLALWVVIEGLFSILANMLLGRLHYGVQNSPTNRVLAVIPGALQGLVFAAVILTVLALVPFRGVDRRDINGSVLAGRLVQATLALERPLEGVFGPAARESLGFITVKPPSGPGAVPESGIKLNFTVGDPTVDAEAEEGMLGLVNRERSTRGLAPLTMDPALRELARAYARQMFVEGFFAHESPEGTDPFQRMQRAGIDFATAGENLALAPTLDVAHDGLMNSPGHRANILNSQYGKVGIGVMDGGIYGKIFVQEFTN